MSEKPGLTKTSRLTSRDLLNWISEDGAFRPDARDHLRRIIEEYLSKLNVILVAIGQDELPALQRLHAVEMALVDELEDRSRESIGFSGLKVQDMSILLGRITEAKKGVMEFVQATTERLDSVAQFLQEMDKGKEKKPDNRYVTMVRALSPKDREELRLKLEELYRAHTCPDTQTGEYESYESTGASD